MLGRALIGRRGTERIVDAGQFWITCAEDKQEHVIEDYTVEPLVATGEVRAACGHVVRPAALCVPPDGRCRRCRSVGSRTPR